MSLFHPRLVSEPEMVFAHTVTLANDEGTVSHTKFSYMGDAWVAIPGLFAVNPWAARATIHDAGNRARYDIERVEG